MAFLGLPIHHDNTVQPLQHFLDHTSISAPARLAYPTPVTVDHADKRLRHIVALHERQFAFAEDGDGLVHYSTVEPQRLYRPPGTIDHSPPQRPPTYVLPNMRLPLPRSATPPPTYQTAVQRRPSPAGIVIQGSAALWAGIGPLPRLAIKVGAALEVAHIAFTGHVLF